MIGELLVLFGSLLTLLAAIGMFRFDDVFARMHALAKANIAGVLLAIIGAAVTLSHPNDVTSLVLAGILQVLTSPVGANMISVATYHAERIEVTVHDVDELAIDLAATDDPPD